MPMIMITCPVTKQPVSTGLNFPKQVFDAINIRDTTTKCTACGKVHTWNKKDAFLDEK